MASQPGRYWRNQELFMFFRRSPLGFMAHSKHQGKNKMSLNCEKNMTLKVTVTNDPED